tara:strand:+ start:1607 stop:1978 length:372 start_codon:yes stop_codon:yes gene_type:complete
MMLKDTGEIDMKINPHAYDRMALRLTQSEKDLVEARVRHAYEKMGGHTGSLGVVTMDIGEHRKTDNSGYESNGNLVIGVVRNGLLKTVFLRRDTQEVSKKTIYTDKLTWAIKKRATGKKARRR